EQLTFNDLTWRLNETSNNIAILVKHISGNMVSRWTDFLTSDGEKSYRRRDDEFIDDFTTKEEIINIWEQGWEVFLNTLDGLTEDNLLEEITIRAEKHTVIQAIERQMFHYSYHVGQIVFIAKQVKDEEWQTLSIPKGKSAEYLQEKLKEHKRDD
ncbi:MAG TPA: DUF1572 family protein, partial [Bacillota bacterium]|nr:DUF1572 family protein [Bacillota bacterium]